MFRKKYLLLFMGKEVMIFYLFWHDIVKLIRYLKEKTKLKTSVEASEIEWTHFFRVFFYSFTWAAFSCPRGNLRVIALFGVYSPIIINLFYIVSRLTVPFSVRVWFWHLHVSFLRRDTTKQSRKVQLPYTLTKAHNSV